MGIRGCREAPGADGMPGISFSGIIDIEVWQGDHDLHWNMFPAEIEGGVGGEQA